MKQVQVSVRDPALARAIEAAIDAAVARIPAPSRIPPTVLVRSRKTAARRAAELPDAVAIVRVTDRNARHLVAIADAARAAGAAGIQLVWDGHAPPRAAIEPHVFAALEHARATPKLAPIVLAPTVELASALVVLIAQREMPR